MSTNNRDAQQGDASAEPDWHGFEVTPVLPEDPAKIGDFWLDGRLHWRPSGTAYLGHGDGLEHHTRGTTTSSEQSVVLLQLHAGAAADKVARDRFSGMINQLHIDDVLARGGHEQDEGRLGRRFRSEDDDPVDPDDSHPIAPWAALTLTGEPGNARRISELANSILAEVDLIDLAPIGEPKGPDYRLPWIDRFGSGHNRVWPLPWPGRYDRAGFLSILASWLLMVLLATLAVLIAILIFRNSAPQSPPPQPGQGSGTGQTGSGSPGTGTGTGSAPPPPPSGTATPTPSPAPGQGSGSPTPQSPSPSGSSSAGPDGPTPDPSASARGTPTPPSRL
ncbi:hypothetical protein HJ590_16915 [Naumannella sp. ID2617S]|uniref:Uncharacterized protein n=1 Tax=Enemella dayhoffiae TaxID=2016507 RepID=A0A255GN75_9ACTN|nr:hypothetical protein [Enemella dayhoffiae]NNG21205.1 hypothetical protein [Naumannella sp. ID2617S]OYO17265.1 hypothetical protein CGZ93_17020 [Enemella dayhoffiae]